MIWGQFIVLSLAIATASITIGKSTAFEWLRWWLEDRGYEAHYSGPTRPPKTTILGTIFRHLHELSTCPYCLGHWISFITIAIYQPRILHSSSPLVDYFLEALALVALSTFWGAILFRAYVVKR